MESINRNTAGLDTDLTPVVAPLAHDGQGSMLNTMPIPLPLASPLLLNSHHDTVKPVEGWQRNPFEPTVEGERLYGLGSNDTGASAVALLASFLYLNRQKSLPYRLVLTCPVATIVIFSC